MIICTAGKEKDDMWKGIGIFAGGVLFGTAGIKILSSKDAKKVYTHCTAAFLRCKDYVLERKDILQENCTDIYEDAIDLNDKRAAEKAAIEIQE